MTSSPPPDPASLRAVLERSTPAARYDVEAGLARHRALVGSGAPLPEWAGKLPRGRRFGQLWLVSSLLVLGAAAVLSLRIAPSSTPPTARPASAPAPARETAARRATVVPLPVSASVTPPASAVPASPVEPSAEQRTLPSRTIGAPAVQPAAPMARASRHTGTPTGTASRASTVPAPNEAQRALLPQDLMAELTATPSPSGAPGDEAAEEPFTPRSPPDAIDPEVIQEMQQLATAERLLATMPSRTLSLVREGMQRFPRGYLAQERRYLEIMALLALRKPRDAELLSRSFLRDYPNGPYRRKIQRALEGNAAE